MSDVQETLIKTPTQRNRSSRNYWLGETHKDVEHPTGPSETIPDMTMSLSEILTRYSRGLPVPQRTPSYSDEEFPDLERLDLVELYELGENNKSRISQMRNTLQRKEPATPSTGTPQPGETAQPDPQNPING